MRLLRLLLALAFLASAGCRDVASVDSTAKAEETAGVVDEDLTTWLREKTGDAWTVKIVPQGTLPRIEGTPQQGLCDPHRLEVLVEEGEHCNVLFFHECFHALVLYGLFDSMLTAVGILWPDLPVDMREEIGAVLFSLQGAEEAERVSYLSDYRARGHSLDALEAARSDWLAITELLQDKRGRE